MFRSSSVHHQERFVQAVFADLVRGNTVRTARHVQPLRSCRKTALMFTTTRSSGTIVSYDPTFNQPSSTQTHIGYSKL